MAGAIEDGVIPERRQLILHPSVAALWALLRRPHAGQAWRFLNDLQIGRWHALAVEGFDEEVRAIVENPSNRADLAPRLGVAPMEFINLFVEPLGEAGYFEIVARAPLRVVERTIAERYAVSPYDGATVLLAMTRTAPLVVADERLPPCLS